VRGAEGEVRRRERETCCEQTAQGRRWMAGSLSAEEEESFESFTAERREGGRYGEEERQRTLLKRAKSSANTEESHQT
jgi:hypothetical protein